MTAIVAWGCHITSSAGHHNPRFSWPVNCVKTRWSNRPVELLLLPDTNRHLCRISDEPVYNIIAKIGKIKLHDNDSWYVALTTYSYDV